MTSRLGTRMSLTFFLQCSQADSLRSLHTSAEDPPPIPGVVDIPAVHENRSVDTYKIERIMTGNSYSFVTILNYRPIVCGSFN